MKSSSKLNVRTLEPVPYILELWWFEKNSPLSMYVCTYSAESGEAFLSQELNPNHNMLGLDINEKMKYVETLLLSTKILFCLTSCMAARKSWLIFLDLISKAFSLYFYFKKRLVVRVLSKKIVSKALKSFFETTQIEFSILQKPKKKGRSYAFWGL